jgi:hypothetical protein
MKAEPWLLERRDARQMQQIINGSEYKMIACIAIAPMRSVFDACDSAMGKSKS